MQMLPELFTTVQALLPPWALWVLGALLVVLAVPALRWRVRSKRLAGLARRAGFAHDPVERETFVADALALAGDDPRSLAHLADKAHQAGVASLFERARERLGAVGGDARDVERLRDKTAPKRPYVAHPVEEAIVIERMIDEELWVAATLRIDEARARFPDDPALAELADRIASRDGADTP